MNALNFRGIDPFLGGRAHPLAFWMRPVEGELARVLAAGQRLFLPGLDAVRLWLSYGAWQRDPEGFAARFESALALCAAEGVRVVPSLFNRAAGGEAGPRGELFLDGIVPGIGWAYRRGFFEPYLRALVGAHRQDARILFWDICNQPYPYSDPGGKHGRWFAYESELMREMLWAARGFSPSQPVTLALTAGQRLPLQPPAAAGDFPLLVFRPGVRVQTDAAAVLPAAALKSLRPNAGFFVYDKSFSVKEETTP